MAKSSKKNQDLVSGAGSTSEPQGGVANPNASQPEPSVTPAVAPKAAKKPGMTSSAAPKAVKKPASATVRKKAAVSAKPRKTTSRKKPAPAESAVSDEAIRLRAYFLAEKRAGLGLPGDSSSDWLEARRQLLAEAAAQG
jgi:hypothetical protein